MFTPRYAPVRLQRSWPSHILGEVLSKSWIDSVVPVTVMILVLIAANAAIPGYLGGANLTSVSRQFAEFAIAALGIAVVVFCGGIDLSVGAVFALAICVAHDGGSVCFVETYGCRVSRFWIAGPRAGKVDVIIDNLPGHPDNINRASDGTFWLALAGVRFRSGTWGLGSGVWDLGSGIWRW